MNENMNENMNEEGNNENNGGSVRIGFGAFNNKVKNPSGENPSGENPSGENPSGENQLFIEEPVILHGSNPIVITNIYVAPPCMIATILAPLIKSYPTPWCNHYNCALNNMPRALFAYVTGALFLSSFFAYRSITANDQPINEPVLKKGLLNGIVKGLIWPAIAAKYIYNFLDLPQIELLNID